MDEEEIDYLKEVRGNINMAKVLSTIPEQNRKAAFELLLKQKEIREKNGFFAETKINRINKKIEKLKEATN